MEKQSRLAQMGQAIKHFFTTEEVVQQPAKQAHYGPGTHLFSVGFNGEKNMGELGPAIHYELNYEMLRTRSHQAYLESEIAKTIFDRFTVWVVNTGLKLQSNPNKLVLKSENIVLDNTTFNELTEARFYTWANSRHSSYNGMQTLNKTTKQVFKNAKIGGDCLVILRYVKGCVKVEVKDGCHVSSPTYGTDYYGATLSNGNTIRHGVELSPEGEHIAYYVRDAQTCTYTRVAAKNPQTGLVQAFLVYGNEYRLDNVRGLPLIAQCLETLKKLERYKEAAVGSAEERQKIVYTIVHKEFSTGETPLAKQLAKARNYDADTTGTPTTDQGKQLADNVAATTNKQTYNLTPGAEMKALESKNEMFYKEFYSTNADITCGAVGIPPNVAFSIYNDSFSASRAATKDWENTIIVERADLKEQYYQHIYNFWLFTEVLTNKIQAPGYLEAYVSGNFMALEAYQNSRFTGPMFPHIDPLKEVNAERAKLGVLYDHVPLTTLEQAAEVLNTGDSDANVEQAADELRDAEEKGLRPPTSTTPANGV